MRAPTALASALLLSLPAQAWPGSVAEVGGTPGAPEVFPAPDSLKPAIAFWSEIFTRHGSDRLVLHDRERLEIVWGVVELPLLADGQVDEARVQRFVQDTLAALRSRLTRLEADPMALDGHDDVLLALVGRDLDRLKGAAARLRAQRGVADRFREGVRRAYGQSTALRAILSQEQVPAERLALSFVESMFNPKARSSAGAVGIWQLMPDTARGLGLKVTRGHDERYDLLKSTRAAARMLRRNFELLGSWPLAITAYNHGPNGMRRMVQEAGTTDLTALIQGFEKSTWGFSSKNFYAEFLAVVQALAAAEADLIAAPESVAAGEGKPDVPPPSTPARPSGETTPVDTREPAPEPRLTPGQPSGA
ncbi:MAG: lytic transglycosylase domain-containing protein [Deltaproteobacteria bacterium]|nr:lytic transglycosylase domain-containing protein [Deltaproteobacteria bacterium]